MADSYHIIDGQVVPYSGGRKCNDTDAWRDATPLELQLQEQLAESEHAIAAQASEIEALRAEVEAWRELSDHVRVGACKAIWPDRYVDERIRDVAAALKRAERLAEALRLIESAKDRGFGIDYAQGVAQSALLRDRDYRDWRNHE